MNRQEFMRRLEYLLRGIPENERMDALAYYSDYFDEAGVENEYQVIQELGSPESVAQTILEDVQRETSQRRTDYSSPEMEYEENPYSTQSQVSTYTAPQQEKEKMSTATKVLIAVVVILTFPLWIGVVAGLFGGLVGLLGGLFGVVVGLGGAGIGLLIGGAACLAVGIMRVFTAPVEGLVTIALGSLLLAISLVLIVLITWLLFKWLPLLFKSIARWIKGLRKPKEGGEEI